MRNAAINRPRTEVRTLALMISNIVLWAFATTAGAIAGHQKLLPITVVGGGIAALVLINHLSGRREIPAHIPRS